MADDQWRPKIPRYVDAELSDQEMRALDAHLNQCSSCAVEALRQTRLKQATKLAGRRYTPSPQFRQRIAAQVGARKPRAWFWNWAPALTAALVLVVAGMLLHRSSEQTRSRQLLSELADIHVANLAASSPVDVVSSDRHTVKPWFQGKLPFSFDLPELAGSPFRLVGGRVTYFEHEPGAHLIFDIGAHHISLFIFREQPELARSFPAQDLERSVLQLHIETWSAQGLRYFVVGDASEDVIRELGDLLKKAGNR